MATVNGDPNYFIDIRNSGSGSGKSFKVRDDNYVDANTLLFEVDDSGTVTITGEIHQAGTIVIYNTTVSATALVDVYQNAFPGTKTKRIELVHDNTNSLAKIKASTSGYAMRVEGDTASLNTTNSSGTIATFDTNGTTRLKASWDSGNSRARLIVTGTTTDFRLESDRHVQFQFGINATGEVQFIVGAGTTATKCDESGIWTYNTGGGSAEARLTPKDANSDCLFEVGLADDTRGKVVIMRDPVGGGNNRAGVLVLEAEDGQQVFVNVGLNAGNYYLYLKKTDPGINDVSGTQIPYAAAP